MYNILTIGIGSYIPLKKFMAVPRVGKKFLRQKKNQNNGLPKDLHSQ